MTEPRVQATVTMDYCDWATVEWILQEFQEQSRRAVTAADTQDQRRLYQNRCRVAKRLLRVLDRTLKPLEFS